MQCEFKCNIPSPVPRSHWIDKPIQARQRWMVDCFIASKETLQLIQDICQKGESILTGDSSFGVLVLGGSGSGKSKLLSVLEMQFLTRFIRYDDEKTVRPVIKIRIPEVCTAHEINVAILKAFGALDYNSSKKLETSQRARMALLDCEVRLVLVDDFQDVPLRRGAKGIDRIGAHIRDLMDASRAIWCFLGTDEAGEVRNSKNQLIKRIPYLHRLRYFSVKGPDMQRQFAQVLKELDNWLPLASSSCILKSELRGLLYIASAGVFDRLIKLLDAAVHVVVADKRESIEVGDLETAFYKVHGWTLPSNNPFSTQFELRMLNRPDEPYEVLGA